MERTEEIASYFAVLDKLPLAKQIHLSREAGRTGHVADAPAAAADDFRSISPVQNESTDVQDVWFGVSCIYVHEQQKEAGLDTSDSARRRSLGGALSDLFAQAQTQPEAAAGGQAAYTKLLAVHSFDSGAAAVLLELIEQLREAHIHVNYISLLADLTDWAQSGFEAQLLQRRIAEEMEARRLERYSLQAREAFRKE